MTKSSRDSENLSDLFGQIYRDSLWGTSPDTGETFYSGHGSHDPMLVMPYLYSVRGFLHGFHLHNGRRPDVLDIGCGDFTIGARLADLANWYLACDVVAQLIDRNRKRFRRDGLEFLVLDATRSAPPDADITVIRQVLQHLSNEQIAAILERLPEHCSYLVVTEEVPGKKDFVPNLDMLPGPGVRAEHGSGVVLTAKPFSLAVVEEVVLCDVPFGESRIRTSLYKLR
jgi:SAM-dependent methyltransferase